MSQNSSIKQNLQPVSRLLTADSAVPGATVARAETGVARVLYRPIPAFARHMQKNDGDLPSQPWVGGGFALGGEPISPAGASYRGINPEFVDAARVVSFVRPFGEDRLGGPL